MKLYKKEYSVIKEYIDNSGQNPSNEILELKKSPQFETLLVLVDHCISLIGRKPQKSDISGLIHPEHLDEMVLGLLQNNKNSANQFLSAISQNPNVFHKTIHTLQNKDVSHISLDDITIKSNHNLITMIDKQVSRPVINKPITESGIQKLTSWFVTVFAGSRVRLAFVSLVLILGISLPLLIQGNENPLYKKYFLSESLPCEYEHSGFRSRLNTPVTENNFSTIKSQFALAISDYMVKNYSRSLAQLEQIIGEYNFSNDTAATSEETSLYRDIYFFAGICNLALAGDGHKTDYLLPSVKYIKTALNFVQLYDLQNASREYFFLALAHDLLGNKQLALENLGRIQETSIYYIDGLNRKRQLTK